MYAYEIGSPADPRLGLIVEGYCITRAVGQGGMGAVYEAVHQGLRQRAAIKLLFPEFSGDQDAVTRFVGEARAAGKVRHGGLVKVFSHGRLADGTAYLVMEFLDGESLRDRLDRLAGEGRRLQLAEVLRTGQQIASALSAVHREGIIHRDLKPANLLLVADPEVAGGERIKVVDFGIAKIDGATTEIGKTTVGRFLGTALYASPEQCQMAGEIGPPADVYSLGVILYEMLGGRPPFVAAQPGMVIGMHLLTEPRPLWDVAPQVPDGLHALVHEMLAKSPDRRPSMDQVRERLLHLKLAPPRWRFRARRQAVAAGVAATVLLLAGAATIRVLRQTGKAAVVTRITVPQVPPPAGPLAAKVFDVAAPPQAPAHVLEPEVRLVHRVHVPPKRHPMVTAPPVASPPPAADPSPAETEPVETKAVEPERPAAVVRQLKDHEAPIKDDGVFR